MKRYKFFKKRAFESMSSFEERLSNKVSEGWTVINFSSNSNNVGLVVLLEKKF